MNIKWKIVGIGLVLAIILSQLFLMAFGTYGSILGLILAGAYAGYNFEGDYIAGLIHGGLIGFIFGILGVIIILLLYLVLIPGTAITIFSLMFLAGAMIIETSLTGIFGIVGVVIKDVF